MSSTNKPESRADSQSKDLRPNGMRLSVFILAGVFLTGVILQHVLKSAEVFNDSNARMSSLVIGLLAFGVTLAVGWKREWHRFIASNRFAVPVILTLTVLSIVGTVVLQKQPEQTLLEAYGPGLKRIIESLCLDDIFHSLAFCALLGAGAGGLTLTVLRRRRWTVRYSGSVGAHVGLVLVLVGVAVGNVSGVKGRLDLHKGESSSTFKADIGEGSGEDRSLGFVVRLDDFRLLHYEPDYRLMVLAVNGDSEKLLLSVDPTSPAKQKLEAFGVKLLDYWPDYWEEVVVVPVNAGSAPDSGRVAALGLRKAGTGTPGGTPGTGPKETARETDGIRWVFDSGNPNEGALELDEGNRLYFFWSQQKATQFVEGLRSTGETPSHLIVAGDQGIPVEVGKSHSIPGTDRHIEVLRSFQDFVIDQETRTPQNRSDQPNNPAVEVVIKDSMGKELGRTWLFSKFPDFQHQGQDSVVRGLRYEYRGKSGSLEQPAVVVGETGELWSLSKDAGPSKQKIEIGQTLRVAGTFVTVSDLYPSVRRSYLSKTRSNKAENPVVRIQLRPGEESRVLGQREPLRLPDGKVLVLAPKNSETIRDYLSTLTILENDNLVLTKLVEVNDPLEYHGFSFYQTDYRPEDPTFSGFQVVRDPGLWIVYLGFLTNAFGVALAIFVPPLLNRRKRAQPVQGVNS